MVAAKGPNGLTEKQEAFALAYLETGNAAHAYRTAYDVAENARHNWIYVEASQLLDNPKVAQRLEELREQAEKLSIYSLRTALEEYEDARLLAKSEGQAAAAVSAVTGKVKLFGLDKPSRVNIGGHDGGALPEGTGAAKLAAALDRLAERSGTDSEASGE